MKKWIIIPLAAGFLAMSPSTLLAQSATNSATGSGQTITPPTAAEKKAQRRQILAIVGINAKDLKALTPEDRRAKLKAAVESKISELEQKQTAGTITPQEQSDLALLKKFGQHAKKAKTDS